MSSDTFSVTFDTSGLKADISVTQESVDRYISACLRNSCIMLRDYAKKNHKFKNRTGRLERAIKYKVINSIQTGVVYVDADLVPYSIYVGEDTGVAFNGQRYPISPVRAKALSFFWERVGQWVYFKRVKHPGSKADRFLQDALNANEANINKIFADGLRELING